MTKAATTPTIDECLRSAREHVANSDWHGALSALEAWNDRRSAGPQYHVLLAHVLRSLERDAEALDVIAAGESVAPSAALLVTKGKLHRDRGNYQRAREAYLQAISVDPGCADAHCQLGILEQHAGHHDEALTAFQEAVGLDPTVGMHWLCLGRSYFHHGAWQLAETCYARAEAAFEADASDNRHYNMACLASIRGNTDRALELFETFLAGHPYALAWAEKDEDLEGLRADPRFWTLFHDHVSANDGQEYS